MPQIVIAAVVVLLPALLITAAVSDAFSFRIPNWISLALIATFPLAAYVTGLSWSDIGLCAAVGAAALAIGMFLWTMKWIGGGDAKIFAAAALWMGWPTVVTFAVGTMITGGVLAVALLSMRTPVFRPLVLMGPKWVIKLGEPGQSVPYGVALSIGGLIGFFQSPYAKALGL
jgi:prepilin peptidase CpaA